jgi:hypothetical protein
MTPNGGLKIGLWFGRNRFVCFCRGICALAEERLGAISFFSTPDPCPRQLELWVQFRESL